MTVVIFKLVKMIKTTIVPQENSIHLSIPNNYIGKEIEVLLYPKEELTGQKSAKINKASRFKGLLSDAEAEKYHEYVKKARSEWERDI